MQHSTTTSEPMNTSVSSILFSCFKSNQLEMCSPDYSLESPLTYKANKNHYLQRKFPICQPIMHHFLTLTSLQQFSLCCSLETERREKGNILLSSLTLFATGFTTTMQ